MYISTVVLVSFKNLFSYIFFFLMKALMPCTDLISSAHYPAGLCPGSCPSSLLMGQTFLAESSTPWWSALPSPPLPLGVEEAGGGVEPLQPVPSPPGEAGMGVAFLRDTWPDELPVPERRSISLALVNCEDRWHFLSTCCVPRAFPDVSCCLCCACFLSSLLAGWLQSLYLT